MALRAVPQATPTVIQQMVAAGQTFNGSFPAADPTVDASNGIYKYAAPAGSVAGLFLWNTREPITITQFLCDLGAATGSTADAQLRVVNLNPATFDTNPTIITNEIIAVANFTTVSLLRLTEADFRITLMPFQGLQLITTNSTKIQIAQCMASLARSRQW